jgi:hypothetical protein
MEPDKPIVLDDKIKSGPIPATIPQLLRMRCKHLVELDSIVTCLASHIRRSADDAESSYYKNDESKAKNAEEGVTTQQKRSFADFLSNKIKSVDTIRLVRGLLWEVRQYCKQLRGQCYP